MPYELRDFTPALRFLEQDPDANAMMLRAVRQGPRPGFAVLVDDPLRVRAVLLVSRPDWRRGGDLTMTLQLEAQDPKVAAYLMAWLPHGPRYRILTYRPWLSELVQPLIRAERQPVAGPAAGDRPALKMVSGLGYQPPCREWAVEGTML